MTSSLVFDLVLSHLFGVNQTSRQAGGEIDFYALDVPSPVAPSKEGIKGGGGST